MVGEYNSSQPIEHSTAIRERSCAACDNKIAPGLRHLKVFGTNMCNHCFLKWSVRVLGPDYFKKEVVDYVLPEIVADEV